MPFAVRAADEAAVVALEKYGMPPDVPVHEIAPVVALNVNGVATLTANVPLAFGSVSVGLPAAACAVMVAVPLVTPASPMVPVDEPGTPRMGVGVTDGTPPELVFRTPPLAVASPATVLAELEYRSWLTVVVAGQVAVDHAGAALDPD
jgi:hypothetical protein